MHFFQKVFHWMLMKMNLGNRVQQWDTFFSLQKSTHRNQRTGWKCIIHQFKKKSSYLMMCACSRNCYRMDSLSGLKCVFFVVTLPFVVIKAKWIHWKLHSLRPNNTRNDNFPFNIYATLVEIAIFIHPLFGFIFCYVSIFDDFGTGLSMPHQMPTLNRRCARSAERVDVALCFVCRLTVQTPKGEIINQVICIFTFVVFQSANALLVDTFPIYTKSVVRLSNCIYFASYNICAGIKLVEIEGNDGWKKEGVVRANTNEIKLAHWEDSFLAIFIFHSVIFIPFIASLAQARVHTAYKYTF